MAVGGHAASLMADKLGINRRVLVVDDDQGVLRYLARALEREGFTVVAVQEAAGANAALDGAETTFDLALIDQELPDGNGLDLLQRISREDRDTRVVVVTGFGELPSALRAMRLGATDYVEKPFRDLPALRDCLRRSLAAHDAHRDRRRLLDELREKNRTLEALAVRDPTTLLFNHAHLQETIERELVRSQRNGLECALVLLGLDELRPVNHSLGHGAGDRLLRTLAELLEGRIDVPSEIRLRAHDIAGRFGGDTFGVLLPETPKSGATAKAERLRKAVAELDFRPFELPPQTVSVGVAAYPGDASDRPGLVDAASSALYAARTGGRNRMVAYSPQIAGIRDRDSSAIRSELSRLDALDRSIAGKSFDFVYQPIVRASSGGVFAYEALCRPRDTAFPNPLVLIKTAESAGRVWPLGRALREVAVTALARLPRNSTLFVNVHPQELFDPEFIEVESFLAPWTDQIVFEITEVASLRDYTQTREIMGKLRGAGFRVALDDLGAGYSGLNSLAMLRPDFVKLDMQLVRGVSDARTARLIKHIVEFATDEHMMVVAEGVETADERRGLVDLGCHLLQGYYFSKGRPLAEILSEFGPRNRVTSGA